MNLTVFENAKTTLNGIVLNPSFEEFSEQECQVVEDKLKAKLVFHGKLEGNSRTKPMVVIERDGIVLDFDHVPVDITDRIKKALEGYEYTLTNTHSHDPDNSDHCFRVVMATTESIEKGYSNVYWNLVLDNPELKAMLDEGMLDPTGKDDKRCYFVQSIPPERKDKAFKFASGGVPYVPDTQYREEPNKPSSKVASVSVDAFKEEKVYEGTGQRNGFEAREIGRLIQKHQNKEIVIREALIINETQIVPPEPAQEIIRQCNNLWDKEIKHNPDFISTVTTKPTRRSYTIRENKKLPPTEWLVENLIVDKSMNAIYGASGSTKSFLAIDMGMSLALGTDWFGYESYKPIPVIYVAVEGGGGLQKRIDGYIKTHGKLTPSNFYIDYDVIIPKDKKSVNNFIEYYKAKGFKNGMIFIDTLNANARASGIDENSSEMGVVIDVFQRIGIALDSSYTLIHHTGKDESKGLRGHSSIHASLDTILYVQKKDSGCSWTLEKLKDGEEDITYTYNTDVIETGLDSKDNPITTLVIKPSIRLDKQEKREVFRGNQKVIWGYLADYLKPLDSKRANIDEILHSIYERWAEHPSDKRKTDARNSITQLKNKRVLETGVWIDPDTKAKEHDQVWITKKGLTY